MKICNHLESPWCFCALIGDANGRLNGIGRIQNQVRALSGNRRAQLRRLVPSKPKF
jgi:hypothetical protein